HKNEPFEPFTRPPDIKDPRPLHEKARLFTQEIEADFLKDDRRLFWSQVPNDIGDMAIWHGYYLAYRAFEYATTRSSSSLHHLRKALDGESLLLAGYGKAYLVRGVDPAGGDAEKHRHAHQGTPYDWVDDASGSSLTGTVFGLYCAWRYGPSDVRRQARDLTLKLTKEFIRNKFKLTNSNGSYTRWGDCSRDDWIIDPSRILTATALLNFASLISDDPDIAKERQRYEESATVRRIAGRAEAHLLWYAKHYHQHLAYMSFFVLMDCEQNDKARERFWMRFYQKLFRKYLHQGNSFFIYLSASQFPIDQGSLAKAKQTLQEFSFPKKKNYNADMSNFNIKMAGRWSTQPLPVWRRPSTDIVWQRSPNTLKGGNTEKHYSGVDFLVAYWMGRYFGFLSPEE
ncbi:MAG: hypothetical protein AABZ44_05880, partial [Elusimicrobiota bacterium]